MPAVEEIRCVYCRNVKPKPKTGEHIILDGLGGRSTTRDVCDACNQWLGNNVDVEFLRNSFFALHRYFDPNYQQGHIGKTQFIETSHGYWDATLANSGQLDFPPQFALHPAGWVLFAQGPDQAMADELLAAVRSARPDTIHRNIRDVPEHAPARLVLRGKTPQLRARTDAEADQVLALAAGAGRIDSGRPFEPLTLPETMQIRMSVDPNFVGRCAAKMAFNMATAVFGARALLDDAFSPVREYILGTDVRDGPTVGEDGEPAILIDQRYVEPWLGRSSRPPVTSTGVHAIELVARGGGIGAFIGLFGGSEWFAVRLGPTTGLDTRRLGTRLVRRDEDDYWYLHGVWVSWKKMRGRGLSPAEVLGQLQREPTT